MIPVYPSSFPCPMIEGYTIDIDAGVIRSKDRGKPAQRRVFKTMPHVIKCKFALSFKQWGYWQEWLTREGTGWFSIDLPTMYAGLNASKLFPHIVRLSSTITIDAKTSTHVIASMTLELSPTAFKQYEAAV